MEIAESDISELSDLFISKNHVSIAKLLANDEFENPENRFQPFLSDPVMRELCNEYYELQIGDALVTYISNDQILISDITDSNVRNAIRAIPKGETLKLNQVPTGAFWGDVTDIESFLLGNCRCKVIIEKFDCNTIRIHGNCKNFIWGSGDGSISVFLNFNPNFPQDPAFSDRVHGNFEYFFDINFPMNIRVTVNPDCIFGNIQIVDFQFSPESVSCDESDKNSGWKWMEQNGEAINYRVSSFKTWHAAYEQAEVISMRWISFKNAWEKRSTSRLEANIQASRRGSFGCNITDQESESKVCNNCDRRLASVNTINFVPRHCTGDVNGTFHKRDGANTINSSLILEFDCCL